MTNEEIRLTESRERRKNWKRWGPYLSERSWGTVREDYSANGNAWELLPARPRPLPRLPLERRRPGRNLRPPSAICFALALWNGRDPFLKERLFGLTGKKAITARM